MGSASPFGCCYCTNAYYCLHCKTRLRHQVALLSIKVPAYEANTLPPAGETNLSLPGNFLFSTSNLCGADSCIMSQLNVTSSGI